MSPPNPTIFLIGATGFVGSYLVESLAQSHPSYHIICLLRNPNAERLQSLQSLNRNLSVVEGTLDDQSVISQTAEKADVVIHVAHSDHEVSVQGVLEGLKKRTKSTGQKPLYLHMSGCGIIADNARGEKVDYVKEWSDEGLDLDECPRENTHLKVDKQILAASEGENAIRSIILFPAMIYGLGKTQRSGMWIPVFFDLAKQAGHAGTWGPGEVTQYCVHVKDVVSAVICVLGAALEGSVKGGKEDGLFFVTTQEPTMSWKEINDVLGDMLYAKGLVKEPKSRPFPKEITEPLGHYGWSLLGSNGHSTADRLASLGWKPEWTRKVPLRDVLPQMLEIGISS